MLSWVGSDQPMKMKETSRAQDKKPTVNNDLKKNGKIYDEVQELFYQKGLANGCRQVFLDYIWNRQIAMQKG